MKKHTRKFRNTWIIIIVLLLANNYIQAQNKSDCKYSKNTVDEFTKKTDVRTKPDEIFYKKEIAPSETGGATGLWCKKTITASACNINGLNYLLIMLSVCNSGYSFGNLSSISLLLQNGEVVNLNNEIQTAYRDDCTDFWQFYSATDSIWSKLKTTPIKKIKVIYDYGNKQQIFEIVEKNMNKISSAIDCIDALGITKSSVIQKNQEIYDNKQQEVNTGEMPRPTNDTSVVTFYKQWKLITSMDSSGVPKDLNGTFFLQLNTNGSYKSTYVPKDGKATDFIGKFQLLNDNKIIVFTQDGLEGSYSSVITKFTKTELVFKSEKHQSIYIAY